MAAGRRNRSRATGIRKKPKRRGKRLLWAAVALVVLSGAAAVVIMRGEDRDETREYAAPSERVAKTKPDLKMALQKYLGNPGSAAALISALAAEVRQAGYDLQLYADIIEACDGASDGQLQTLVDKVFALLEECTDGYPGKKALYDERIERLGAGAPEVVARLEWRRAQLVASEIGDKELLHQVYEKYRESPNPALRLAAAEALYRTGSIDDGAEKNRQRYEQVLALSGESQDAGWRNFILRVLFSRMLSADRTADRLSFLDEIALGYGEDVEPENFSIIVRALRERAQLTGDDSKLSMYLDRMARGATDTETIAEALYCQAELETDREKVTEMLTRIISRFGALDDGHARRVVGKTLERLMELSASDSAKIMIAEEITTRFRNSADYLDSDSVVNALKEKARIDGDSGPLLRYYDACIRGARNRKRRAKLLYDKAGELTERYDRNKLYDEIVETYGNDNENDVLYHVGRAIESKALSLKDEEAIAQYRLIIANPLFHRPRWSNELQRAYRYVIRNVPEVQTKLSLCDEFIAAMDEIDKPAKIGAVLIKCYVTGDPKYTIDECIKLEDEFFDHESTSVNRELALLYGQAAALGRYPWVKAHFYDFALNRLGTSFDYSGVLLSTAADIVKKKAAALDDHMIIEDYFQARANDTDDVYAKVRILAKWAESCWSDREEDKRMIRRKIMDEGRESRDRRVLRVVGQAAARLLDADWERQDLERVTAFVNAHVGKPRSGSQDIVARLVLMLAHITSEPAERKRLCNLVVSTYGDMIGMGGFVEEAKEILGEIEPKPAKEWWGRVFQGDS